VANVPDARGAGVTTARERYVQLGLEQLGKKVLWAQKGPDVFDCSGLATWLLKRVDGPDLTHIDNAQALYDATRALGAGPTDTPLPGDYVFYGFDEKSIEHVAIWLAGGHVLSADGASSHITTLEQAKAIGAGVHVHMSVMYRRDCPYVQVHRNTLLDALDQVER
jgi:cell wall-associated NlpC family hydrolase